MAREGGVAVRDHVLLGVHERRPRVRPERWRDPPEAVEGAGHGGSDARLVAECLDRIAADGPPRIGLHEAMDATLPGPVSQVAVDGDEWLEVPDSRAGLNGRDVRTERRGRIRTR